MVSEALSAFFRKVEAIVGGLKYFLLGVLAVQLFRRVEPQGSVASFVEIVGDFRATIED